MDGIKIKKSWNWLSEDEKKIASHIAMQIPISCDDVAHIFLMHCNSDIDATIGYIAKRYGFVVDKNKNLDKEQI